MLNPGEVYIHKIQYKFGILLGKYVWTFGVSRWNVYCWLLNKKKCKTCRKLKIARLTYYKLINYIFNIIHFNIHFEYFKKKVILFFIIKIIFIDDCF